MAKRPVYIPSKDGSLGVHEKTVDFERMRELYAHLGVRMIRSYDKPDDAKKCGDLPFLRLRCPKYRHVLDLSEHLEGKQSISSLHQTPLGDLPTRTVLELVLEDFEAAGWRRYNPEEAKQNE